MVTAEKGVEILGRSPNLSRSAAPGAASGSTDEVVRPSGDPTLRDDRGKGRSRRDVEGRISGGPRRGNDPSPGQLLDFAGVALLDRDGRAVGDRGVDGRKRRGHVERDP